MSAPITTTKSGMVKGSWQAKGKVAVFKGIPFAKPPVGDLRWRPPQPLEPWEGIKKTTKFGPFAMQQDMFIHIFIKNVVEGQGWNPLRTFLIKNLIHYAPKPKQSEDCLYLNVRTPKVDPSAKLPVMVWIHGGDHQDGSGGEPFYDGNTLAQKDVVCVYINYRLGLMGYYTHPELSQESEQGVCGNYGTLDQIAALQWVQDNITAFGGDPNNVTIFGESAGGESVAHMLSSPLAKGLFHKAILQSPANAGQMMQLKQPFLNYPSGEDRGLQFAKEAGVSDENQVDQLRKLSAKELKAVIQRQDALCGWYPVVDGYVLPKCPFETFQDGDQTDVPVLLGSNSDEGTLIHPVFPAPLIEFRYRDMPKHQLPDFFYEEYGEDIDELLELYPGLEEREPEAELKFLGDDMFGAKVRFYAEQIAKAGQKAYFYFFTRIPPSSKQFAGAYHAAEIPFVHGINNPIFPLDKEDMKLSAKMVNYWTQFAKTGDPNGLDNPTWEPFDHKSPQWMHLSLDKMGMENVSRELIYGIAIRRIRRYIGMMKKLVYSKA